jgi:hypothetical protein
LWSAIVGLGALAFGLRRGLRRRRGSPRRRLRGGANLGGEYDCRHEDDDEYHEGLTADTKGTKTK